MAAPDKVLTNKDLEKIVDTSDEWIRTRTGMVERRKSDEHTAASDVTFKACEKLFERLEFLIYVLTARVRADLKPLRCVPPSIVLILFAKLRIDS